MFILNKSEIFEEFTINFWGNAKREKFEISNENFIIRPNNIYCSIPELFLNTDTLFCDAIPVPHDLMVSGLIC